MKGNKLGRPALESAKRREKIIPCRVTDADFESFIKEAERRHIEPAKLLHILFKKYMEDPTSIFTA